MPNTLDAAAAVRQGGGQGGVGERLNCSNQGIEQLGDLSSLAATKRLDLAGNAIATLTSFTPPPGLKHLDLKSNALAGFSGLSLASLRVLDLSSNRLAGAFHLAGLPSLAALILSDNKLTALTGLASAPELATLVVKHNAIADLAPALARGAAKALVKLSAAHNAGLTALDVAPCPALAELRVGHCNLSSLPTGLGPRLRVLDVGGNPRLGRAAAARAGGGGGGDALAAAVAPLAGKPWLRAVTLRGTALGGLDGIKDALMAALPDLQILDDKRVAGRGVGGGGGSGKAAERIERRPGRPVPPPPPPPPPPSSPPAAKKLKVEEKEKAKQAKKEKKTKVKAKAAAVGRLADETALAAADAPPGAAPPAPDLPPPPPPPPVQAKHGQAAVKVLPGAKKEGRAGGALTGGALAALLAKDGMEDVGGWG